MATPTPGMRIVAKTPEGKVEVAVKDAKPWWYYDTIVFPANQEVPVEARFFQIPKGQEGKTEIDTNVLQYSTLPKGWKLLIYSIRIATLDGKAADLKKLMSNSIVELELGGTKRPFAAPTWVFTQGGGLFGEIEAAQQEIELITNGLPTPQSILKLPYAIDIEGGESFNLILKTKAGITPSADVKLQAVLDCIAYEPVRGT